MSLPRCNSTGGSLGGSIKRRPRPLKMPSNTSLNRLSTMDLMSIEEIIVLMENVTMQLNYQNYDYSVLASLAKLCESLKQIGPQIESLYQDQLDKLAVAFRNSSRSENLDLLSRVHILEIIELRARNWIGNENLNSYYRQKYSQIEQDSVSNNFMETRGPQTAPVMSSMSGPDFGSHMLSNQSTNLLSHSDVIANSGRFVVPTKIPGKNYFKDEVVIRNSDSGKVMGLRGRRVHMIEEMTDAVISFQRVVPGARERLVQITGSSAQNIEHAKRLIEETIRRNQSPARDIGLDGSFDTLSLASDDSRRNTLRADQFPETNVSIQEYKYTVNVADESIKITGCSLDLVRTAKLVLDEYFSLSSTPIKEDTQYEDMILRSPSLAGRTKSNITAPPNTRQPLHLIQESNFSTLARSKKNTSTENAKRKSQSMNTIRPKFQIGGDIDAIDHDDNNEEEIVELPSYNPVIYSRQELLRYSLSEYSKATPGKCDAAYKPWRVHKKGNYFNGLKHAERVNLKDLSSAVCTSTRILSQMDCAED